MESGAFAAAISLVVALVAVVMAASARWSRREQRLRDLDGAIWALKAHYAALDKLDNDATPEPLLRLALRFSEIIHEPAALDSIAETLTFDPDSFERSRHVRDAALDEALRLAARDTPEIVSAFAESVMTGLLASVLCRPDLRRAFPALIVTVASDPAEEAARVVTAASARSRSSAFPAVAAAAA